MVWAGDTIDWGEPAELFLPYGQGRSYGDCCLNDRGVLIDTSRLSRFMTFDSRTGVLRVEAGTTLAEVLDLATPHGWFVPVTPGTKHVSIGGAIANDVHGKNHHVAGTFGCHVRSFELLRSSGKRVVCSATEDEGLFQATIGGLGLTGLILWAELQLKPIASTAIEVERIRFTNLRDFFALSEESDERFEYTVAWIDCLAPKRSRGRGIFFRGNHAGAASVVEARRPSRHVSIPIDAPSGLLNRLTAKCFNEAYYWRQSRKLVREDIHYDKFFYPLDGVGNWNRLYGARGFLQYQCVVGEDGEYEAIDEILGRIGASGLPSFLAVLKRFGRVTSPGMLSFPRPGVTLALDFPNQGQQTLDLLECLDEVVRTYGGAVYPAKDARMSPASFKTFFPRWKAFSEFTDHKFSSSFWRRVTLE